MTCLGVSRQAVIRLDRGQVERPLIGDPNVGNLRPLRAFEVFGSKNLSPCKIEDCNLRIYSFTPLCFVVEILNDTHCRLMTEVTDASASGLLKDCDSDI